MGDKIMALGDCRRGMVPMKTTSTIHIVGVPYMSNHGKQAPTGATKICLQEIKCNASLETRILAGAAK